MFNEIVQSPSKHTQCKYNTTRHRQDRRTEIGIEDIVNVLTSNPEHLKPRAHLSCAYASSRQFSWATGLDADTVTMTRAQIARAFADWKVSDSATYSDGPSVGSLFLCFSKHFAMKGSRLVAQVFICATCWCHKKTARGAAFSLLDGVTSESASAVNWRQADQEKINSQYGSSVPRRWITHNPQPFLVS